MKQLTKKSLFDQSLLNLIVCPLTKKSLIFDPKKNELVSKKANLAYPIIDGIPILIIEKARKL